MGKRRAAFVLAVLAIAGLLSSSCAPRERITIGLSLGEFTTGRWKLEADLMVAAAKERGVQVVSRIANHDPARQILSFVDQKVDAIIVIPEDGVLCAPSVAAARRAGVKVIAYDRIIKSADVDAFVSFDSVEVGRAQAKGVLKVKDSGDFLLLGGSKTDFNAHLLRKGQLEVLSLYQPSGRVRVVAEEWVDGWQPANAFQLIERMLKERGGRIDAIVASNDGTALAAVNALKAWNLNGKVPVSGQDASLAGCKAVLDGSLSVTVLKDFRNLAPIAVDSAIRLIRGEPIPELKQVPLSELTLDESMRGSIACRFLPITTIDRTNLHDEVVRSGFQPYDAVYADIPPGKRPPRP